ncbi:SDR family oxidoreductase [Gluconacetobacter entanii]|uniref:SDR family oxidoreductase n=1 Tax=Gluconacetobacter entanii TaxID=108528 RepID=A0ABT3K5M9_9PROT|nr:SDR family oxidoreductase [Gluconacetobacter entanii]MCW4590704.1 SDR family oxidoreductase [Gluconacetobacter entanii]MCW4592667.1 SDR family oxidoreductase [Gluconacetobacter entanii]NPC89063.1 SDR family oxidoreductase [Gluconacetobacter entanii]
MTEKSAKFSGKVALLTGAGGNIGLACAHRLARSGAAVALLDMNAQALQAAEKAVAAHGVKARSYVCDVTDIAAVRDTVAAVVAEFGAIDFLFNNAGYQGAFAPVQEYPEDDFARVMDINVRGAFHVLRTVSQHMVARRFGRIVNTASMAGVQGPPNMAAYGASKFAIIGLTEVASKDLAPYNIRVNAISPAFMGPGMMWDRQVELQAKVGSQYFSTDPKEVAKQMIGSVPMRRYGNIEEIPGVVEFLLGEDSSYMTGVNLPIAGGIL